MAEGRFREDLYARINMWTFNLMGLAQRTEDIEPNLDFELERYAQENSEQIRFNVEAKRRYLEFALSPDARWLGNFRELTASVTRMATLAQAGRVTEQIVIEEIARLRAAWQETGADDMARQVLGEQSGNLDLFERCQLNTVIAICRKSASLSEAGRKLFSASRQEKKQPNDADRLRKYLARFGLDFEMVRLAGA